MSNDLQLDGATRTAVLLMSIGEEHASKVMQYLDPREVQKVGTAMTKLKAVNNKQVEQVLDSFVTTVSEQSNLGIGVDDYLRKVLTDALGADKGGQVVDRIIHGGSTNGIEAIKWMEPRAVAESIRLEHPQIIAIIVSHLDPDMAAEVLSHMAPNLVPDIVMRVATLETIQPEALRELDAMLERQFSGKQSVRSAGVGGVKSAAEIMNYLDSSYEERVLTDIQAVDESLASKIQDSMFVFENLIDLDNRSAQALLRELQTEDLIVALKGASEGVREKFISNMSRNAAEMLREDLEARGPVKLSDVEARQKEIVAIARRLSYAGEIVLASKGGEAYV
jgi:flagellar motor switch protein FliG